PINYPERLLTPAASIFSPPESKPSTPQQTTTTRIRSTNSARPIKLGTLVPATPVLSPVGPPPPKSNPSITSTSSCLASLTTVKPTPFGPKLVRPTSQAPETTSSSQHVPPAPELIEAASHHESATQHRDQPAPACIYRTRASTMLASPSSVERAPVSHPLSSFAAPLLVSAASSEDNGRRATPSYRTTAPPTTPSTRTASNAAPFRPAHYAPRPATLPVANAQPLDSAPCRPLPVERVKAATPTKSSAAAESTTTPIAIAAVSMAKPAPTSAHELRTADSIITATAISNIAPAVNHTPSTPSLDHRSFQVPASLSSIANAHQATSATSQRWKHSTTKPTSSSIAVFAKPTHIRFCGESTPTAMTTPEPVMVDAATGYVRSANSGANIITATPTTLPPANPAAATSSTAALRRPTTAEGPPCPTRGAYTAARTRSLVGLTPRHATQHRILTTSPATSATPTAARRKQRTPVRTQIQPTGTATPTYSTFEEPTKMPATSTAPAPAPTCPTLSSAAKTIVPKPRPAPSSLLHRLSPPLSSPSITLRRSSPHQ
ncbi:hypothetical protein H0H81_006002, partial [Sphagnurus paluster]